MCGIAGFMQAGGDPAQRHALAAAMADTLAHRGPDAGDAWADPDAPVALGHRRLSIIDLSTAGAQPMPSASGRYLLTYNGEIYNFRRLRREAWAADYPFRGHSDSEVILAAVEAMGVERAVARLEGMFALALWDRRERRLWLARDRVGKKPLYYGWHGDAFLFGSELKALRRHPAFQADLDRDALGQYLQYGWVAAPRSIYGGVRKLPQGCLLEVPLHCAPWSPAPRVYWSAAEVARRGAAERFGGGYDAALDRLDEVLREAVADRMVADVEIGALLSGGIDSSTVVALMQQSSDRKVKTFSIGFGEDEYNEAPFAAAVARHLGTDHHELYVTPQQALDTVPRLPEVYDEPFADASQIPTLLVSQLAREQLKVVLTGDGGDEQFAGYRRYRNCLKQWRSTQRCPAPLRPAVAGLLERAGPVSWSMVSDRAEGGARVPRWSHKLAKSAQRAWNWRAGHPNEVLANKFNKSVPVDRFVAGARDFESTLSDDRWWLGGEDPLGAMLHYDYIGYLPDDILVKVDRASMAVGLEARAPLLDHRVLEVAWSLPWDYIYRDGRGKRILRDLLLRYVPRALVDRPKRGFSVPVKEWLAGPLRPWAEELLDAGYLARQGVFEVDAVRDAWRQHLSGWANHSELLWAILMFQAWWERR